MSNAQSSSFHRRFAGRYAELARAVELDPTERVVVALSGGADSVLLAYLIAAADPRPDALVVHVDHRLRGRESELDARFCERLCARLGLAFALRRVELDPDASGLEARAREARYGALLDLAERRDVRTILTGHHADDALETLLMRWSRGSALGGLAGLRERATMRAPGGAEVAIVRPLIHLRREEVRCLLRDVGATWREDSSNADPRHTRNRIRGELLPQIATICGDQSLEHLRAFGRAIEALESGLAGATAHLRWDPPSHAAATRAASSSHLGGELPRSRVMSLPGALRRRAVWRLVREGCGRAPRASLLELVLRDLESGRTARHALPRGWMLVLQADRLLLLPPREPPRDVALAQESVAPRFARLPFPLPPPRAKDGEYQSELAIPGLVDLPDGRRIGAEPLVRAPSAPPPRSALEVEIDADKLAGPLSVRHPRAGDRFQPLGASGTRPLVRFLADAGVPRDERARVALVCAGDEIVWVAGLRPSERARIDARTSRRIRLRLYGTVEPASAGTAESTSTGSLGERERLAPELFADEPVAHDERPDVDATLDRGARR